MVGEEGRPAAEQPSQRAAAARDAEERAVLEGDRPRRSYDPKGSCATCHGTTLKGAVVDGVTCESCHGPASGYVDVHQQKGAYRQSVAAGLADTQKNPDAWAPMCVKCHVLKDAKLIQAGHPSGDDFDLGAKFASVALHWKSVYPNKADIAARARNARASIVAAQRPDGRAGRAGCDALAAAAPPAAARCRSRRPPRAPAPAFGRRRLRRPHARRRAPRRSAASSGSPMPARRGGRHAGAGCPFLRSPIAVLAMPLSPSAAVAAVQGRVITLLDSLLRRDARAVVRIAPPPPPPTRVPTPSCCVCRTKCSSLAIESLATAPPAAEKAMSPGTPHEPAEHAADPEEVAAIQRLKQYPVPRLAAARSCCASCCRIWSSSRSVPARRSCAPAATATRRTISPRARSRSACRSSRPIGRRRRRREPSGAPPFPDAAARVLRRGASGDVVQRGGLGEGSTVMVTDVPVDLAPNEEVLLEAGDVFGEMSALSRYPISADVVARTDVTCLLIRVPALRMMFKQKELAGFKTMIDERYRSRTLANQLRSVELFAGLDEASIAALQAAAQLSSYEPGAVIVAEGRGGRRLPSGARRLRQGGGPRRRRRRRGQLSAPRRSRRRDRPAARPTVAAVAARHRSRRDGEDRRVTHSAPCSRPTRTSSGWCGTRRSRGSRSAAAPFASR